MCGAHDRTQMTRMRADFVSAEIRQIRAIRVLRRGKFALCASKKTTEITEDTEKSGTALCSL